MDPRDPMRTSFKDFYPPSNDDFTRLWDEGLIVVDTNVLLDLYRLPAKAREELLAVLANFQTRLWIPFQVAMEFQLRRIGVASVGRRATEDIINEINSSLSAVLESFKSLEISKRAVDVDVDAIEGQVTKTMQEMMVALEKVKAEQLEVATEDPIRDQIDALLKDNVGLAPIDQAFVDAMVMDGQTRYDSKIPPGFEDAAKEKNPTEATHVFRGIKYHRKFGDLMLWKQLLDHVEKSEVKCVLFVTSEKKSDWWWREHGRTLGPHPALRSEMGDRGKAELFWMYSTDQFLEYSGRYTEIKVSAKSVKEVKEVQLIHSDLRESNVFNALMPTTESTDLSAHLGYGILAEEAVLASLSNIFPDCQIVQNKGFPDFIVITDNESKLGYEVSTFTKLTGAFLPSSLREAALRGRVELASKRLDEFRVFLVIRYFTESQIFGLRNRLVRFLKTVPINEIIVGTIVGGKFAQLFNASDDDEIG